MLFWMKMILATLFTVALFAQPFIVFDFSVKDSYFISATWLILAFLFSLAMGPYLCFLRKKHESRNIFPNKG